MFDATLLVEFKAGLDFKDAKIVFKIDLELKKTSRYKKSSCLYAKLYVRKSQKMELKHNCQLLVTSNNVDANLLKRLF